jgi:hypothetical protein
MKEAIPAYVITALLGPNAGSEDAAKTLDIWVSGPIRDVYSIHRSVDAETYISMSEADLYRDAVAERNRRVDLSQRIAGLRVLSEQVRLVSEGLFPSENTTAMILSWVDPS